MPAVECRTSSEQDQPFLFALFCDVRAPEFALADLPPPALEALLKMQFQAQASSYALRFPLARDVLLWSGQERIGRMLVDRGDAIHLINIGLTAAHRGRGIGTVLLRSLLDEARDQHLVVKLEVRHGNPALRLYQRLGFAVTGDNGMDIAMECRPFEAATFRIA